MSLATDLSTKDQHVLSAIFAQNEEAPRGNAHDTTVVVDMTMPPDPHVDTATVEQLVQQEKQAIRLVEDEGGHKSLYAAMEIFNNLLAQQPQYASAYNNRAQLRRLLKDEKRAHVVKDLKRAIELAHPHPQHGDDKLRVSKMQGTILCQAYSQLGGLYLSMVEEHADENGDGEDQENTKWQLEEQASNSLYQAGLFGNELARAVATKVNPYAKLCGNMVREAMIAEYSRGS